VELLAEGRTAEVFAWGDGRVLKLDRPEWNGMSTYEATVLAIVAEAGLPVARPYETVTVEERTGVVLDRIDGPMLSEVIASADDVAPLAAEFIDLHQSLNELSLAGLPELVPGVADGVGRSGLPSTVVAELLAILDDLDDGRRALCHFDLHPGNVLVGEDRWVVIDWITASLGPPDADFARTLLLDPPHSRTPRGRFMTVVERDGMQARGLDRAQLDGWIRVLAAARLAEGFGGEYAQYLSALASGARRIDEEA
jgi:Ser/Thr protein kinase RdoA (MazF antagonist)